MLTNIRVRKGPWITHVVLCGSEMPKTIKTNNPWKIAVWYRLERLGRRTSLPHLQQLFCSPLKTDRGQVDL